MGNTKIEETKEENKVIVRTTAIICFTILSVLNLLGLYWGKTGIKTFGIVAGIFMAFILFYAMFHD